MSRRKPNLFATTLMLVASTGLVTPSFAETQASQTGTLNCALSIAQTSAKLLVQFDDQLSVAEVDHTDHPADFTSSHIRIRLAQEGPVLTIGRVTGRVLATDSGGKPLGAGTCTAALTA